VHDIDISLLRTFIILVETQNFTRTAERIHRSQSAVSMQIAKLEEQLGCSLFQRDKRNIRLTIEGEKLRSYAVQIVSLSDNLVNGFVEPQVEGNINFGSPEDFATNYLPDILSDFVKARPRVTLNVNCDLTLSLINDFEKNKYDLIVIKQKPGKLHTGAMPLWREQLVWVGSDSSDRDYTFKKTIKKYCKNGTALPLVLSPAPCVYRQGTLDALDKIGVPWKVVYTSPSYAGATAAVKAGLGFTVFPRNMVSYELICLEQSRGWPRLKDAEICLLAKSELTPVIESLVTFIQDRISYNYRS
jgi:DNA-binding transcriptional LysR family regulator